MRKEFYAEYFEIEAWHWWCVARRRILLRLLDRQLANWQSANGQRKVLDFGCGSGALVAHLSRYGQAEGADVDEEAVDFCHQRGLDSVRLVQAVSETYAPQSFDLVTALDVLEHVDDDSGLLRDLYTVLRPGGWLLVSVPAYQFLWGRQDEVSLHRRRYIAGDLLDRIQHVGFSIQRSSYFNTLLFPMIAGVRVLRRFFPDSGEIKSDFTMSKPGLVNNVLARIFSLEAGILDWCDLPFGASIAVLARK
jgi:2-polyprenyl-3-methyl-5-hydroxy-6-metoxy-1,4-benzoquinol methylase